MSVRSRSSRSRYHAPLPFAAEVAHCEWKKERNTNRCDDDFAGFRNVQAVNHPSLTTVLSRGITSSVGSTKGYHDAIVADSRLPYQRMSRTDLQKMVAELDLMDDSSNTSSNVNNLVLEITPSTESSGSSNGKFSSPGQSTDDSTPDEISKHQKVVLQPKPLLATSSSQARKGSVSGTVDNMQTHSSVRSSEDQPSQGKAQTQSASLRAEQQDYRFPTTTRPLLPSIIPRQSSQEKIWIAHQHPELDIPPYKPYRRVSTEHPERGRNRLEQNLNRTATRLRIQDSVDDLSQPNLFSQDFSRRPSHIKSPQSVKSKEVSNTLTQSPSIRNDMPFRSPESGTDRLRVSPSPPKGSAKEELPVSGSEGRNVVTEKRGSPSAALKIPSLFIISDPGAQNLESRDIKSPPIPAMWRRGSRPDHAGIPSKRQARSASVWRPPSVWYEKVDGVTLSTRPKSSKESRGGLSIPEIEARDIRNISPFRERTNRQPEPEFTCELADRDEDYASSPPGVGANLTLTRGISPRPAREMRDHVFFDNYSRAAADEMPDQRANPPRARRSESISRMTSGTEVIREMPIAESQSHHDDGDVESTESEAAMPPDVARLKSLEEQDAQMTSRTDQVRSLLGGMMKSLSVKSKRDSKNDSVADYRSIAEDPTKPDRGTLFFLDDTDGADSVTSRPNTVIWSPPKATGRYSEDWSYWKRDSFMGNRSGDRTSGQFHDQSTFVSLGGPTLEARSNF